MAAAAVMSYSSTQTEARQASQASQVYLNSRLANGVLNKSTKAPFTVPEINIAASFLSSLEDRKRIAVQIREACTTSGFFHITGHGVPEETRQAILALAKRYFKDVPRSKREAIHVRNSKYLRGYEPADYTYVNPGDWEAEDAAPETKEGFNWGYEAGLDPTGGDGQYRELDGEDVNGNLWPSEEDVPGITRRSRSTMARYLVWLGICSVSLRCPWIYPKTRLLYYPAPSNPQPLDPKQKDKQIGLGAHSDYECFTILLCSTAPGLEILSPDDQWIPAPAVKGSFIINVADFLMRWTNGVYKSTVHRVVNRTRDERYSVPFFFSINYDQMVETLPSCVSAENPSKYPPIKAGEYVLERLRATAKDE
ncbi:hypothetical protein LTR57_012541 [Friedmanniomyces endolithicus]|nr:hypothetical protein LTR57_012541 [Friedmanniomyces endolithicus]KAK0991299.1 hypothetical protein LTS01_008214 [Friedmanniomyces endolithicus]